MLRYEPSVLVLVLCACAAKEPPAATPPLPTASCPSTVASVASPPPIASASPTPSTDPPPPIVTASASTSPSASPPKTPPEPPIPTTPLAGTVDGRPFTAVSAIAVRDPEDADYRVVWLFDRAVACGVKLPPPGVRAVSARTPWQLSDGFASEALSSGGAKPSFHSVRGAVLEMTTQPGGKARLLLRVKSNAIDVTGEVKPTVCP